MKHISKNGFTLAEFLVYTSILAVLLVMLTTVFTNVLTAQLQTESTSNVQQDIRIIFAKLSYDVYSASAIVAPNLGETADSLQLTLNSIANTYSLDASGNLQIVNNLGTNTLNSFDTALSNLTFQRLGNNGGKNTIKVSFRITSRTRSTSGYEQKDVSTTIGTR